MDFIRKENIHALQQWLAHARRCVVVGHTHPDGDALGSTTGLALYLQSLGLDVACLYPDSPADNLRFILNPAIPYFFHDVQADDAGQRIAQADLIFLVDANAFSRTEALEAPLQASSARKVLLDHHLNPDTASFGLVFSTPDISSASEVVYWILRSLTEEGFAPQTSGHPRPDKREGPAAGACAAHGRGREATVCGAMPSSVGEALMIGMTTDTNNFANSVFPSTFQMASELIAAGVDRDALLVNIYNSYRENRVRLMGYMQSEELHILPNGTAYMILTRDIQLRFDMRDGESEGLVNVPLTIGKVRLSVLLKEDEGHFRVSVRSKKGTSAQQLANTYFHGGGHENAAGGKLFIGQDIASAQEAPACLERILKEYLS